MSDFEIEVTRDIQLLTGLALWDPIVALERAISEETRRSICMNDDLTFQMQLPDRWRHLYIADPQAMSPDNRTPIPQLVLGRDVSLDLQQELGWFMATCEAFPLGSMTLAEQQQYLTQIDENAVPIEADQIDGRVKELAQYLLGY